MTDFKAGDRVVVTNPEEFSKNFYREGATGVVDEVIDPENIHVQFDGGDFTPNPGGEKVTMWWAGSGELSLA